MEEEKTQPEAKLPSAPSKVVQTLTGDMAQVLEDDKEGLVKKIIHGEEQHEKEKSNLSPQSKKNRFFLFVSILLIALASGTIAYFVSQKGPSPVQVAPQFVPLVFLDKSDYVDVGGLSANDIADTVQNEIAGATVASGQVEGMYFTVNKQAIGLRAFISLIKGNFAPDPNPLLVSDNFLTGLVQDTTSTTPSGNGFFMLLKMRTPSDIFDSMHAWESKMFSDLHGFLGIPIDSTNKYLLTKDFDDGVIENKNARILHDADGNIVLMYIYADDNSVVIASTQAAAHEIMVRLAGSQVGN